MRRATLNFAVFSDADMGRLGTLLGLSTQELSLVRLRAAGWTNERILRETGIPLQKLGVLDQAVAEKVTSYQDALEEPDDPWSEVEEVFHDSKDVARRSKARRRSPRG